LTLTAMSNLTKERPEILIVNASGRRTFPGNEPVRIRRNGKKQTPSFVTFADGFQHRDDRGIPDSSRSSNSSRILWLSVFAPILSHPSSTGARKRSRATFRVHCSDGLIPREQDLRRDFAQGRLLARMRNGKNGDVVGSEGLEPPTSCL
jgi:hypothetical protein